MIVAAGERMKLDLSRSWIVGDRASDIGAGRAAELEGGILISPREDDPQRHAAIGLASEHFAVDIAAAFADAAALLLARGKLGSVAPRQEPRDDATVRPRSPR